MGSIGYPEMVVIGLIAALAFLAIPFGYGLLLICINNEPAEGNDKMTWVIVIAVTGVIGALVYYLARRPTRKRLYGR